MRREVEVVENLRDLLARSLLVILVRETDAPEISRIERMRGAEFDTAAVEEQLAGDIADLAVAVAREQRNFLADFLIDADTITVAVAETAAIVGPRPHSIVPLGQAERPRDVFELGELEHRVGERAELIV